MGITHPNQLELKHLLTLCKLGLFLLEEDFVGRYTFSMKVFAAMPVEDLSEEWGEDFCSLQMKVPEYVSEELTEGVFLSPEQFRKAQRHSCNTAGCALGYAALLPEAEPHLGGSYWALCSRMFGFGGHSCTGNWLFASAWKYVDDTPEGAAWRILYFLDRGVPGAGEGYSGACRRVDSLIYSGSRYWGMPERMDMPDDAGSVRKALLRIRKELEARASNHENI